MADNVKHNITEIIRT